MHSGANSLFRKDDQFYWAGWANGYKTKYQQYEAPNKFNPSSDAWIYRYDFEDSARDDCIYATEYSAFNVNGRTTYYDAAAIGAQNIVTLLSPRSADMFEKINKRSQFV